MTPILPLLIFLSTTPCSGILTGVDRLQESPYREWVEGKRIGLVTNHTGVNCRLESTEMIISQIPGARLTALFAPEHGIRGDSQAGRKIDSLGIVHSLYGEERAPSPELLDKVEVLIFDIQDVGARFYTYTSTMLESMKAAAREGIPFLVLDRPVPIDGARVEGPVLEKGHESFVGSFQLPIRYAMTPGELALLLNSELEPQAQLDVVPLKGWKRTRWFDETGLTWISPSPNMATLETASIYPGFGLIEGTNLSEGRGTTHPFELVGAPWLKSDELVERLNRLDLPGVRFRAQDFEPWFSKYQGETCHGIQIHMKNRSAFQPIKTVLHFLSEVIRIHPSEFQFRAGFDRLAGNSWIQLELSKGTRPREIQIRWQPGLRRFLELRKEFLLYPESGSNND